MIKGFLFLMACAILPLTIPFMWYYVFTLIFLDRKDTNFVPPMKALGQRLIGKKPRDYGEDEVESDFDVDDLELVTKVDEIE